MNRIRKAIRRAAEYRAACVTAQPGEVWTASYEGDDFNGNFFESYTAGTVRILAEECPVAEYRGHKILGEGTLDPQMPRLLQFVDAMRSSRKLARGDNAPDLEAQRDVFATAHGTAGDYLALLPTDAWVTVEYRDPHPVYAGLRNVVVGYTYDRDVRDGEAGRDVGGDWVPFEQVTAVYVHSHAEVAS